jgi:hypothetical protein
MNRSQLFPSRFLKAIDLQGKQIVVVIDGLKVEDVGDDQKQKPVLHFKGAKKGLVLNATNYDAIADAYGDETEDWPGQLVELFSTKVDVKGKRVGGGGSWQSTP